MIFLNWDWGNGILIINRIIWNGKIYGGENKDFIERRGITA